MLVGSALGSRPVFARLLALLLICSCSAALFPPAAASFPSNGDNLAVAAPADTVAAGGSGVTGAPSVPITESPDRGERLFSGSEPFAAGGPACATCHDIAGLRFPRGGTLGPNLTMMWAKYGPQTLPPVLSTLYFPTMTPIFATRPLTPQERADLTAFLRAASTRPRSAGATLPLALLAFAGCCVLALLIRVAWSQRLGSVRSDLFARIGYAPQRRTGGRRV